MSGIIYRLRILTVHILYILYSCLLWWRLVYIGKQTGHPESETNLSFGLWLCGYLILNGCISFSALSGSPSKLLLLTWCNIPMLVFIIFNLPPFGFTLLHLYELAGNDNMMYYVERNHTCIETYHIPMSDFMLLQMVMPTLLATFIIYPLPRRDYVSSEYLGIAMEFMNAFDLMDMVTDVSYAQKYGSFWTVLFFVSLGISAILIAFPVKIENEDLVWPRRIVICAQSELNLAPDGMSISSILTAPYIIEAEYNIERPVSVSNVSRANEEEFVKRIKRAESIRVQKLYDEVINAENAENNYSVQENTKKSKMQITEDILKNENITNQDENVTNKDKEKSELSDYFTTETWRKLIKVSFTMIFMDILFAVIRFKIMVTEQSADYGFNMFIKNVILAGLHMSYLIKHIRSLVLSKLDRIL